jgi:hypothetical protein
VVCAVLFFIERRANAHAALGLEAITHSRFGQYAPRLGGIHLQLAPQVRDVYDGQQEEHETETDPCPIIRVLT